MNQTYPTPNLDASWEQLRQVVQEQAELIRALQAKKCECHIIDPAKIRILLWINRPQGKPETATLKIGEQRLLGLPRSDRRGESYFRFDEIMEKKLEVKETPQTSFKCSQCSEETVVIGADNPAEEIRQRETLKKELAQLKPEPPKEPSQVNEPNDMKMNQPQKAKASPESKNSDLKEQIAQAIAENKKAQNEPTNSSPRTEQ